MSPKFLKQRTAETESGRREALHVAARILRGFANRTCVKLYRSWGERRREMDAFVAVVGPAFLDVRVPRSATRMPGSVVGRTGMQLRTFNEVSRLAADPTRRGVARRRELAFHLVSESIIPSILPGRRPYPPPLPSSRHGRLRTSVTRFRKGWRRRGDGGVRVEESNRIGERTTL